jgi:hypothetical protein
MGHLQSGIGIRGTLLRSLTESLHVTSERATPNVRRFGPCRVLELRLGNNVGCERLGGDVL